VSEESKLQKRQIRLAGRTPAPEGVNEMATMALPIRELERSVCVSAEKARAETERVVSYSVTKRADMATVCKVAVRTVGLKWLLSGLVRHQEKLISACQQADFTRFSDEDLADLASSLQRMVAKERGLLAKANTLGAEIRGWWGESLLQLSQQVEHMDSIAESLHLECDPEASLLLAMAVEQFSSEEVAQVAM
jgi:hypothetical protein